MPAPPTPEQVDAWVRSGVITPAQGNALLGPPTPPRSQAKGPGRTLRIEWGPSPSWRSLKAPAIGLALGLLLAVALVVGDTQAVKLSDAKPGDFLDWGPASLAALTLTGALFLAGSRREAAYVTFVTLFALLAALHPDPRPWMTGLSLASLLVVALVRVDPATRVVASFAAMLGAAIALTGPALPVDANAAIGGMVAAYLLLLWFQLPFASGWRRVPFILHFGAGLGIVAILVSGLVVIVGTGAVTVPERVGDIGQAGPGDLVLSILALLALLSYPVAVLALWRWPHARGFTIGAPVRFPTVLVLPASSGHVRNP